VSAKAKEERAAGFRAEVLSNQSAGPEHYILSLMPDHGGGESLKPKGVLALPRPGQFYMLQAGPFPEPLLKRPLCYFKGHRDGSLEFLYRVRGKGTRLLAKAAPGDTLEVLGPLGRAWPRPQKGKTPVIVAGGTGLASVFPLIRSLKGRAVVFYGSACGEEVLFQEELEDMAAELRLSTDDGSCGTKGTVIDALGDYQLTPEHVLYSCGPEVMTSAVAAAAKKAGARGYASLEAYMACGVGACMGCVVMTTKGYRRVCREGPVFKLEELVF
jgi:dihydroorotate dehydrogenase electron transfer subunit